MGGHMETLIDGGKQCFFVPSSFLEMSVDSWADDMREIRKAGGAS
jgi:hypothetical protein